MKLVLALVVASFLSGCAAVSESPEVTDALCAELYRDGGQPRLLVTRIACGARGWPKSQ